MKQIGSFIELELPRGREFYKGENNIARLNTGRAAIWHAFRLTGAEKIWIPYYQCESVRDFLLRKGCTVRYYHQDVTFTPIDIEAGENDAVLLVNYYGIMSQKRMSSLAEKYPHAIIDNSQAFFCRPLENLLNVYSARKFVGVPDGAYVIGRDAHFNVDEYPQCYSSDTAGFLMKRIEYGCEGKAYEDRELNEARIDSEDAMKMSKLTRTLLDGADYEQNMERRRKNFIKADELFSGINLLNAKMYFDEDTIPMVYPLVVEDDDLLKKFLDAKHFQGHWWKYITDELPADTFEHWLSRYVIPITIDQRYDENDLMHLRAIVDK